MLLKFFQGLNAKMGKFTTWFVFAGLVLTAFITGFKAEDAKPNGYLIIICVICTALAAFLFVSASNETNAAESADRSKYPR